MGHVGGKACHHHDGGAQPRRAVEEDPLEQGEAGALVSGENGVQPQPIDHRKNSHARQRQQRLRRCNP